MAGSPRSPIRTTRPRRTTWLDGSKAVQRFAHKHSVFAGCYRRESHPAPSPDGRRILTASNWAEHCGSGCGETSDIEDY